MVRLQGRRNSKDNPESTDAGNLWLAEFLNRHAHLSIKPRKVKVGNLNIHYFSGGRGEPLLIIHGGNASAQLWVDNMEKLVEKYTVYVPDLPGYGRSQAMAGAFYVPELVEFIEAFSRAVGLEGFYLMGHSIGGGVATSYAMQYPSKVRKLVLIDSLCLGRDIALWVRLLSPAVCRSVGKRIVGSLLKAAKWITRPFRTVEPLLRRVEVNMALAENATNIKSQTLTLRHRLSEIKAPTLVVWGDSDSFVPVDHAYAAANLIPDCTLKIYRGSGHSAYRQNLNDFSQTLLDFLG